jgi:hypothetical protein
VTLESRPTSGFLARNNFWLARDPPRASHWPPGIAGEHVAITGDVFPLNAVVVHSDPMEVHYAARRKALSLQQTWWRL